MSDALIFSAPALVIWMAMAMPIVETRAITGGVDTHADVHVAAALDPIGGLLGVQESPATAAGYAGCWATALSMSRSGPAGPARITVS